MVTLGFSYRLDQRRNDPITHHCQCPTSTHKLQFSDLGQLAPMVNLKNQNPPAD